MNDEYDFIIGFDFGHGETSVAKVDVSEIDPLSATIEAKDIYIVGNGREPKIPSMIGYDYDRNIELNFDAYQFKFLEVAAYFKAPMVSSERFDAITDENKDYFKDFAITVFDKLHNHPKNQDLKNKRILYFVACPSGWNKNQRDEYLKFFTDYCHLPISGVIEESRAAHVVARRKLLEDNPDLYVYDQKIAVLDLGSSTMDITMHSDRTYTDGDEIGAGIIEDVLLQHFLETDEEFKLKYKQYEELEPSCNDQILFLLRTAKEDYFNMVSNGVKGEVMLRCQIDWSELSSDEIPGVSYLKVSGSVLNNLLDSDEDSNDDDSNNDDNKYIKKLRKFIMRFITQHGKVDYVMLTGGASQMPFFRDVVMQCYGLTADKCIVDSSPSYSISQGTAVLGYLDTFNPLRTTTGDPGTLTDLLGQIPNIIESEVLNNTVGTYKTQLTSIVDQWETKEDPKTLRDLYNQISSLLASWQDHYDQISLSTNKEVAETISNRINDSLSEMMRLYFGYNVQMASIHFDYDFCMTLPEETLLLLIKGVAQNLIEIINHSSIFRRFKDPDDWDKDRSDSPRLLYKLSHGTKDYISAFFEGCNIDMHGFEEIIQACKDKTRDFYYECIRKITCQV